MEVAGLLHLLALKRVAFAPHNIRTSRLTDGLFGLHACFRAAGCTHMSAFFLA
jgi:hypothetical protein